MTATDGPAQDRRPGAVLVTGGASGLGAAVALAVRDAGGRPFERSHDLFRADRARIVVRAHASTAAPTLVGASVEVV